MANVTVFISCASEDIGIAERLYDDLKLADVEPWLESRDLLAGQSRNRTIGNAVRDRDYFLLLVSKHSVDRRGVVQRAQKIALDVFMDKAADDIFIVPAMLDGTELKEDGLRDLHGADLSDYGRGLEQLLRVFGRDVPGREKSRIEPKPSGPIVDIAGLPETDSRLFGRSRELEILDGAWEDSETNIVVLAAWGGVGKTALVNYWLNRMRKKDYGGARRVYGISFYSQGAEEGKQASAEPFIINALRWFGDPRPEEGDFSDKTRRLVERVKRDRTLLVLDGLEPLQHPPGPEQGRLKDHNLKTLLKSLAAENPGLCVVTTRLWTEDLKTWERESVRRIKLGHLEPKDGAALLKSMGVDGTEKELIVASKEFDGHALALSLLGTYLKTVHDGDVRQRDKIAELIYEDTRQGKHARRVLTSYENWLSESEAGRRQLNILRIMGLFDRPAEKGAVDAVLKPPEIPGLTDGLTDIAERDWKFAVNALRELRLLTKKEDHRPDALDTHPLIREHFGEKLRNDNPAAWKDAHGRLYEYYKNLPEKDLPDTLEEMEPLFAAVAHGCRAGRHQEALVDVYWERICRKKDSFINKKLGAFGSDLAAVSNFFEVLWTKPADGLGDKEKAGVLNWAGFGLRALGRLREAAQPMQAAVESVLKQENWTSAASGAGTLSELWLTIGDVPQAVSYARQSVEFADKSGDGFQRESKRTALADAFHQANDIPESQRLFEEAEAMQKERRPEYPWLYSLRGFRYCDLLLSQGKYREVQERFEKFLQWRLPSDSLLTIAIEDLSAGKAFLLQVREQETHDFTQAETHLNRAVEGLVKAGVQDFLVCGLLSRAALYRLKREFPKARSDIDEAFEIADRGGMKLYLTDYHLESCRLRLAEDRRGKAGEHLEKAAALVAETGYHRRDGEVAELGRSLNRDLRD